MESSSGYRWRVARKQHGERFEMAQHQKQGCDNRGFRLDVEVVGEFLHGATLVGLGSRRRRAGRDKKARPNCQLAVFGSERHAACNTRSCTACFLRARRFPQTLQREFIYAKRDGAHMEGLGRHIWALVAAPRGGKDKTQPLGIC